MKKKLSLLLALVMVLALATGALATEFVPSVEQKDSPTLSSAAVIRVGGEEYPVPTGEIIITPLSRASSAESGIKTRLQNAYATLKASSLETLIPGLKAALQGRSMQSGDLVVKDVIDVQLTGTALTYMQAGGSLRLTLGSGLNRNQFLMLSLSPDGSTWQLIDSDNGDGTVTFTMNTLGVIILLTDGGTAAVDNSVVSPKTADMSWIYAVGLAAAAAVVGACVCIKRKKSAAC